MPSDGERCPGRVLAGPAAARPLVQWDRMGPQAPHRLFEIVAIVGENARRRRFAQRVELRTRKAETLGQYRGQFGAAIDNVGDGGFAQPVGAAGVEAQGLQAALNADCAG